MFLQGYAAHDWRPFRVRLASSLRFSLSSFCFFLPICLGDWNLGAYPWERFFVAEKTQPLLSKFLLLR